MKAMYTGSIAGIFGGHLGMLLFLESMKKVKCWKQLLHYSPFLMKLARNWTMTKYHRMIYFH